MFDNLIGSAAIVTLIAASLGTFVVSTLKTIPKYIFSLIKDKYGYSISCDSDTSIETYMNINRWLLQLDKAVLNNHINIRSYWSCGNTFQYLTLDYGTYIILYHGTFIHISKQKMNNGGQGGNVVNIDDVNLNIFGFRGRAVKDEIQKYSLIKHQVEHNMLMVHSTDQYNEVRAITMEKRSFDTVFTPHKDVLIKYLDKWKGNKELYKKHGLNYKTGILLEGPPGTGKSSLGKVIASYMNYNLYVITDIASVKSVVSKVKENSVILMEDIDCTLDVNRESLKKDKSDSILEEYETMSNKSLLGNVLNILDGVASPENVIFIATTNCIEKLDAAVIRKGRFNLCLHIGDLEYDDAYSMCKSFDIDNPDDILTELEMPVNPSILQEKILAYI